LAVEDQLAQAGNPRPVRLIAAQVTGIREQPAATVRALLQAGQELVAESGGQGVELVRFHLGRL
jgi:hypothetical protein